MNKPRMIDANKLVIETKKCLSLCETFRGYTAEDALKHFLLLVDEQPTIDGVEVVRCEDCTIHNKCVTEDVFKFTGVKNPFCCAGKKVQDE